MKEFTLQVLPETYAVASFPIETDYLSLLQPKCNFFACIQDTSELTIVCEERKLNLQGKIEPGWRVLKIEGVLEFTLVGILAKIATVLADAGVSIFTLSTYQTDYILVKEEMLKTAISALQDADYQVIEVQ